MSASFSSVVRAAMLGLASGILSQSALAVILFRTPTSSLPGVLRHRWIKRLVVASAAGEVVANAVVTSLPPRTDPGPLGGRIVMGALAGGLATRKSGTFGITGAVAGGLTAPAGAWISTNSRARLSQHIPDKLIAVVETVVAFGLAKIGTRR